MALIERGSTDGEKDEKAGKTDGPLADGNSIVAKGSTGSSTLPVIGAPALDESEEDMEARLAYESLMRHRKARRRKKLVGAGIVGAILLVAIIAWAAVTFGGAGADEDVWLSTEVLERTDFTESIQASGTVQPVSSVVVTPEVEGTIAEVCVEEGQEVAAGDTLFTIKNDDLDTAVKEAELAVRSAEAALSSAKSAYNSAYSAYANGTSYTDPETGEVTVEKGSWADVEAADVEVDSAGLALESAEAAYDTAVANAAKRTVTAPESGSIVVINAVSGASTQDSSGTTLIQIADVSQMIVTVQVNEVDISRVAVGQRALVTFSALDGVELEAQVTRISTVASGDSESSDYYGIVTYDVTLLISEPAEGLKPGMTASVHILLQDEPDVICVSTEALMCDDGESYYAYVVCDYDENGMQLVERRDVTVGAQSDTEAVITSGLDEGEEVVLDPYMVDESMLVDGSDAETDADADSEDILVVAEDAAA